ncbi:uncharacterized protein LOC101847688 [Aplysia californica]|uniref:Uncharacterized protein LOC101847688 n=1 Tax=Aplysia californica TaxID=6500 RepID=A0ABM1A9S1_APLCA|nr:uncharacterized protein LOC101847688 [Aplysia californica]
MKNVDAKLLLLALLLLFCVIAVTSQCKDDVNRCTDDYNNTFQLESDLDDYEDCVKNLQCSDTDNARQSVLDWINGKRGKSNGSRSIFGQTTPAWTPLLFAAFVSWIVALLVY